MNCLVCQGELVPYNLPKEKVLEKYFKCKECNRVYASVSIPNYKVTK